jgi:hypothetical protein
VWEAEHLQADCSSSKYSAEVWQALLLSLRWVEDLEEDRGSKVGIVAEARLDFARIQWYQCYQLVGVVMLVVIQTASG